MVVANIVSEQEKQPDQQKAPAGKPLLAMKVTGTVKWFNVKSGYGFINREDTGEDVFVHQSAIVKNNPKKAVRSVGDGETVEFDVVAGEKGNEAANVTGPNGEAVKGSPYAADKRRGYRQWYYRGGARGRGRGAPRTAAGEAPDDYRPRRYRGGYGGRGRGGGGDMKNGNTDGGDSVEQNEGQQAAQQGRRGRGRGGLRRGYGRGYYSRGGGLRQHKSSSETAPSQPQEGENGGEGMLSGGGRGGRGGGRGGRGGRKYRRSSRPRSSQPASTSPNASPGQQAPESQPSKEDGWSTEEPAGESWNSSQQPQQASTQQETQAVQNTTEESSA